LTTTPMNKVIQHIRSIALLQAAGERTDGQLLESFVRRREEAALEALVRRHSPMVWGVCGRILHNHHDAEDAFQATFLVLVRKAASVKPRQMVGNWLYGVAHQTALKARATRAKRQTREREMAAVPEPAATEPGLWRDLQPLLDEELSRLPDKYRVAIVLCDLEGKTRKEAARQLACPEGTVAGRLTRARIMLAKRLARRNVALSGGALAAVLSQQAASAAVPASVVVSTIKAATLLAAGKAAATGAISVKVAALTEGVMKTMLFTKLKTVLAVVLILGFVATGATTLTSRTAAGQEDKPALAEKPVKASPKQEVEKEGFTASVSEVRDFQGEWVVTAMEGDGQKASADDVKGMKWVIKGNEITASDPDGSTGKMSFKLDPGKRPKEIDVTSLDGNLKGTTSLGIYAIEGRRLRACLAFAEKGRPKEFATATGDGRTLITLEKKDVTAWGKEAGGLQAGLGYLPGQHRTYQIGETVTLVVRVRNVRKEAVKVQYLRNFFMEKPPTVTDGEGKPVPFAYGVFDLAAAHLPVDVNLAPGKEIELYELKLDLRPASESGKAMISTLYGTGKFQIQYERVLGNSSAGQIKLDSALSKLATGKLELEIKAEPPAADDEKAEKNDARTSLAGAIKALNTKASHDPIGKDETPITEPEVVAAIRVAKRPDDSAVTDKLFDAFKKIAETKQLPPRAELEAVGGPWDPGGSFVYDVWWVRVRMPKEANGTYSFVIRERVIRSRTLQEEMARLEPKPGEEKPVDGGRTQGRIDDLKTRIEKMKTK
jgi:RNA polymerase sigma factor (sigma-70 family)